MPEPIFNQVLTSAQNGIRLSSWSVDWRDFPLPMDAQWSVRKHTLHGGKQEDVDIIEVDNGSLRFVVIPTRAMSVLRVESGDVRLGWNSPVKEVVHPRHINLESRGGLGWLEGFNEWMTRCGLEWAGHPGVDKFRNNLGDEVEMNLTVHGKLGNIPASEVQVILEPGPPPRLHIRGLVEERLFFGPQLSLWTDISTELGSRSFRFDDQLANLGAHPQEFQILYHANFGPPLLGAGARFHGAVQRVTPFNARAAEGIRDYANYTGPQLGFIEQVYCLHPKPDQSGRARFMLQNPAGDRGVSVSFPVAQLPRLTLWKNLASEKEGYVTGIEPGVGFPYTRRLERRAGRVPRLAPGESRRFTIDYDLHADAASVAASAARIQDVQGADTPQIDPSPEEQD